jgi:phosphatidylserine/phosphatidylglycerophosphate/cardiolipin synthase-like enzyme
MKLLRAAIISAAFVAIGALSHADPDTAPTVHYAPAENLEHIDVELIDSARHEVDFAASVLTDWPVMQALIRAAERGAKVRIYLDASQLAEREPAKVFQDLAQTRGVEIRVKRENSALMHLKSYEVDGQLLRTGAANFSASSTCLPKKGWIAGPSLRHSSGVDAASPHIRSPPERSTYKSLLFGASRT